MPHDMRLHVLFELVSYRDGPAEGYVDGEDVPISHCTQRVVTEKWDILKAVRINLALYTYAFYNQ